MAKTYLTLMIGLVFITMSTVLSAAAYIYLPQDEVLATHEYVLDCASSGVYGISVVPKGAYAKYNRKEKRFSNNLMSDSIRSNIASRVASSTAGSGLINYMTSLSTRADGCELGEVYWKVPIGSARKVSSIFIPLKGWSNNARPAGFDNGYSLYEILTQDQFNAIAAEQGFDCYSCLPKKTNRKKRKKAAYDRKYRLERKRKAAEAGLAAQQAPVLTHNPMAAHLVNPQLPQPLPLPPSALTFANPTLPTPGVPAAAGMPVDAHAAHVHVQPVPLNVVELMNAPLVDFDPMLAEQQLLNEVFGDLDAGLINELDNFMNILPATFNP